MKIQLFRFAALFIIVTTGILFFGRQISFADAPLLNATISVSDEPLLGGNAGYKITLQNTGNTPVEDKGYNLTITDTLPISLSFVSANPAPTHISKQPTGETLLVWDNIADLEVNETIDLNLVAKLDDNLSMANAFINQVTAAFNTAPDNSGNWVSASAQVAANPQAIDIEMQSIQSTGDEQAGGAGELNADAPGRGPGADWPYQYKITVQNNDVGNSQNVAASAILPPGVAYLGGVTISPNPNNVSVTPTLTLQGDGSLQLRWSLGALTPTQYDLPVVIHFDTAIPYKYRTISDTLSTAGPFAGPMSGSVIPEDALMPVDYEATATYAGAPAADGSQSTPDDDAPVKVTAEYLTVSKSAAPSLVGIGSAVTFNLNYYVSEYYTATNVILTDLLPDGMTYVNGSANITPFSVSPNTPGSGQTTLVWHVPVTQTTPGNSGSITFQATVDFTYEAAPYSGQPIVSGDSLTNQVDLTNHWLDDVNPARSGNGIPDHSTATVSTRMPTFSKQVWSETSQSWINFITGFTGDTVRFRLVYDSAADVDAKGIIIRDFLPRGMTYVNGSAAHNTGGTFSNGVDCNSAPTAPTTGWLSGLQYVEWRLCNASQGSHWEATVDAVISDIPDAQPGWLVANFGKLSGHNTFNEFYSLRDIANVDYIAPELELVKNASPDNDLITGDEVVYTISVTNLGEAPAYNLSLTDTIPADLLVLNQGGSASPSSGSYTTISGNPSGGTGGTIQWGNVAQLNPGQVQTFSYTATIPGGLPAGYFLTNIASVGYNSRADNNGHQTNSTSNPDDLNTGDKTIYVRGVTLSKSANTQYATIGDTVRWTLTGRVPAGLIAYWPVIEDNALPYGFDYVSGTTVISGAVLDMVNHPNQPDDDGHRRLNWYLQTLDNSAGSQPMEFTVEFDTLVTGVNGNNLSQEYYLNYQYLENARNRAFVRWYETVAGAGSGYGVAYTGGWRSGAARYTLSIRQPSPTIVKSSVPPNVEAGQIATHTLTIFGAGNDIAHELLIEDALPDGTIFVETVTQTVTYPFSPPFTPGLTDNNAAGTSALNYQLDALYVGSTWSIIYTTRISDDIAAGRTLTNTATAAGYSSQSGNPPDTNNDGLPDERAYVGASDTASQYTPAVTILKEQSAPAELTFGSSLVYTLTLPAHPINATIYDAVLTDAIDNRLQVTGVTNAVANGNTISATFPVILPNAQQVVVIETIVPASSSGQDGDIISNTAHLTHRYGSLTSNTVEQQLVAPALTINKEANQNIIHENDTITYTLTMANTGSGLAQNLLLTDTLPANMSYISGSTRLNGQPSANPINGAWTLPDLNGGNNHQLTFQAYINSVTEGQSYLNRAAVSGDDSRSQPIPADNSSRVPADADPDDQDTMLVFSQLNWITETTFVAYEDLKNTGWSDWDYNDLVIKMEIAKGLTADDDLAALRINYESLARGAAYDHDFIHKLPLLGSSQAQLSVRNANQQIIRQENMTLGDDPAISIFEHTVQALPPLSGYFDTNTRAGQPEQVYGYTAELTIYLNDPAANPDAALPPLPWDPYIHVYNTNEEVHLIIPGHLDNMQTVNAAHDPASPLLGYDLPLAQTFYPGWQWPLEFAGIWKGYPHYVDHIGSGGTTNLDWYTPANGDSQWLWSPGQPAPTLAALDAQDAPTSRYFAGPVAADLNGDGVSEIVIGSLLNNQMEVYNPFGQMQPGWPQAVDGGIKAAAAVVDLDGDGDLEIIAGAGSGKLYAWHHTGQAVSGWPVTLDADFRVLATPAVAHLDGDNTLDIVTPLANGKLYAHNADGTAKSGWPVSIGNVEDKFGSQLINSSPRIADLDGNGSLEIVVGSTDKKLYALNSNGSVKWSYASGDMIFSTPVAADIDPSRAGLEVAFGSGDSYAYLLDKNGDLIWKERTGWTIRSSAVAADIDGDSDLEVLIGSDDNKLWAWHHTGQLVSGWPQSTGADLFSSPRVGDIDGGGDVEVVIGSDDAKVYAWKANGDAVTGWPKAANLSVKGTPALANLDDDAAMEVTVGDFGGTLFIWNFSGSLPSNQADLSLKINGPTEPVTVGSLFTYTLSISNAGPSIAGGVILTATLPAGVNYNSAASSQGACAESNGVVGCNVGLLADKGQATVTITVEGKLAQTVTHSAVVTGIVPDPNSGNNTAQISTQLVTEIAITPGVTATLAYTGADPDHRIQVIVPGEAITDAINLRYQTAVTRVTPANFNFAGHAFHLDAYQNDAQLSPFQFKQPVSVTIHYSNADVAGLDENELQLLYRDPVLESWADAACGPYRRNPTENWLSVSICHLTEFGLFEVNDDHKLFLPIVLQ